MLPALLRPRSLGRRVDDILRRADPTSLDAAIDRYITSLPPEELRARLLRSIASLDAHHRATLRAALAVDLIEKPPACGAAPTLEAAVDRRFADGTLPLRCSHFLRACPNAIGQLDRGMARGLLLALTGPPATQGVAQGGARAGTRSTSRALALVVGLVVLLLAAVAAARLTVRGGIETRRTQPSRPHRLALASPLPTARRRGAASALRWLAVDDAVTQTERGSVAFFRYDGTWEHVRGRADGRSNGTSSRSWHRGDTATIHFFGTRIRVYVVRGPANGFAAIAVDGNVARAARGIDTYGATIRPNALLYDSGRLDPRVHVLTITVRGRHAAPSRGDYVNVDGAEIAVPAAPARAARRT